MKLTNTEETYLGYEIFKSYVSFLLDWLTINFVENLWEKNKKINDSLIWAIKAFPPYPPHLF